VIAAYGDHVVMDETLAGAAWQCSSRETAPASPPAASAPPGAPAKTSLAGPEADRAREALSRYNGAIEQLNPVTGLVLVRKWTRCDPSSRS